jgi:hypothetical protein
MVSFVAVRCGTTPPPHLHVLDKSQRILARSIPKRQRSSAKLILVVIRWPFDQPRTLVLDAVGIILRRHTSRQKRRTANLQKTHTTGAMRDCWNSNALATPPFHDKNDPHAGPPHEM